MPPNGRARKSYRHKEPILYNRQLPPQLFCISLDWGPGRTPGRENPPCGGSHQKTYPRNTQANRKALSAVKIDASFFSMGWKHILGTAAVRASQKDGLTDKNMRGVPRGQERSTPAPQSICRSGWRDAEGVNIIGAVAIWTLTLTVWPRASCSASLSLVSSLARWI